ncbi:hypothetical protein AB833_25960 [Chromatiales bacterium (ex Bugula neritina AB1)]|nr:hypothetical protein AB833_25960 [Chromatiales bacterium (ex Bugula neritina AB1)]
MKRVVDIIAALIILAVLSPIILIVAGLIRGESGSPVFYRQVRVGYQRNTFELLKFRTMKVNPVRDHGKELDPADPEITFIGRFLRRFKIDELPQLLNVLRGQMSLVGPRPPLPLLLSEMNGHELKRFDVLPGLTGLAQVNGNIHLSWTQRFKYDLQYVDRCSFLLDMSILLKTILIVCFGEHRFVDRGIEK